MRIREKKRVREDMKRSVDEGKVWREWKSMNKDMKEREGRKKEEERMRGYEEKRREGREDKKSR